LTYVYENTSTGSVLRQYFVRDIYYRVSAKSIKYAHEKLPHELPFELVLFHAETAFLEEDAPFITPNLMVSEGEEMESEYV
jgi:hypothetical protein